MAQLVNHEFLDFAIAKFDKLFDGDKSYYLREDYLFLKLLITAGCEAYFKHCVYQCWEEEE